MKVQMMKLKLTKILWGSFALLASLNAWSQYALSDYTLDSGGGTCARDQYVLSGTIGQPDASEPMTGGSYSVMGGFWADAIVAIPRPLLSLTRSGANVIISWPATFSGYSLQTASDLKPGALWTPVSQPAAQVGNEYRATVPIARAHQFFRLVQ